MKKANLIAWTCSCLAVALGACGLQHANGGPSVVKYPGQDKAAGKDPNGAATRPASQPATVPAERLAEWIAQLGSDKVADRDTAQKALVGAGKAALAALRVATEDRDPERAHRAREAVEELTTAWGREVEGLQLGLRLDEMDPALEPGAVARFIVYVRNRSDRETLLGDQPRVSLIHGDYPLPDVRAEDGRAVKITKPDLSWPVNDGVIRVRPGERQQVGVVPLRLSRSKAEKGAIVFLGDPGPGVYRVSYSWDFKTSNSGPANWAGRLKSGDMEITVKPQDSLSVPPPQTRPATQPATVPAERLVEWIAQLGSEKVAEREAAHKALVLAGKGALEALRTAAGNTNVERAIRAQAAIGEIILAIRRSSRFAIYLVSSPSGLQEAEKASLADLELESDPVYAEEDIVRYEWAEHILHLTPEARRRVLPVASGYMPFVVVANGERCYLGAFLRYATSYDTVVPCIWIPTGEKLPADAVRISDGGRNDPRSDPRIRKALEAAGKLKAAATQPTTTLTGTGERKGGT